MGGLVCVLLLRLHMADFLAQQMPDHQSMRVLHLGLAGCIADRSKGNDIQRYVMYVIYNILSYEI